MKQKQMSIGVTILVAALLAGCGGGSDTREMELEQEIEELKEEVADLEEELDEAPTDADVDAARREGEQEGRREGEQIAEDAREAQGEAEQELEELEDLAGQQRDELNRARTKAVFDGLASTATQAGNAAPTINPSYRSVPKPDTDPDVTFDAPTTSSSGKWFVSSFSSNSGAARNQIVVYSDVEAPTTVPFKDSTYNTGNTVVNAEGEIIGRVTMGTSQRDDVAGGNFPRSSSGTPKSYDLADRGLYTTANRDDPDWTDTRDPATDGPWRDASRYPERYNAEVTGATLGGASGRFVCSSTDATTTCTVQRVGDNLLFAGPWTFRPSSATVGVKVADSEFMYFGWWSQQTKATDSWAFRRFHGPNASQVADGNISGITSGTATYRGPAVGHYAISELHGSVYGQFTARATFTADFAANTISGMVDQFSGQDDWSVTLNQTALDASPELTTNGTTWTIDGAAHDGGSWSGNFYSDLPSADRNNVVPIGIAGEFRAEHGDDARMIGVFGAHRQQ